MTRQDWYAGDQNFTIEELVSAFTSNIYAGIGNLFSMKTINIHPDKAWMTASLKNLLHQQAFHNRNINIWYHYRDKARFEIIERKRTFYADKDQSLKKNDTRSSWKLVKKIFGQSNRRAPIYIEKNRVTLTGV